MADFGLNYLVNKKSSNPHMQKAAMMSSAAGSMGNDPYGYAAIARIPAMMMQGKYMGEAQGWDEEQAAAAQKQEAATKFMDTFKSLASVDKGAAVKMWNELAADRLGIEQKIDAVQDTPEMVSVHVSADANWWGIDKRTGKLNVFRQKEGAWRAPTEEDFNSVNQAKAKPDEPRGDFDLFYKAMKEKGMTNEQISKAWENKKIRVAHASRPAGGDSDDADMKKLERASRLAARDVGMKFGGIRLDPISGVIMGTLPPGTTQDDVYIFYLNQRDSYSLGGKSPVAQTQTGGAPRPGAQSSIAPLGSGSKPVKRWNPATGRFE